MSETPPVAAVGGREIVPMGDLVVGRLEGLTRSDIYVPESAETLSRVRVTQTGAAVKSVERGDLVLFKPTAAIPLALDDAGYVAVHEKDVLARIPESGDTLEP